GIRDDLVTGVQTCALPIYRPEVLFDDVGVFPQRGVHVEEDHALLRPLLAQAVVDDLALVLRADARQELLLGLGDPQPVERLFDRSEERRVGTECRSRLARW